MKENVGKIAYIGDDFYQIVDVRKVKGKTEYFLYKKEEWVPERLIEEMKTVEELAKEDANEMIRMMNLEVERIKVKQRK